MKAKYGGIAQLARASALHAEGRRFESDYLHHNALFIIHGPIVPNIK